MEASILPRTAFTAPFVLIILLAISACSPNEPRVLFTNIESGDVVFSPVHLEWKAENFILLPVGVVRPGAGHLHLLVNIPCFDVGQVIPADASQVTMDWNQTQADIELGPGQSHTLCLQATDGEHRVLAGAGMTRQIMVRVIQ